MTGTIQRLAARALGLGNFVRPRVAGVFETPPEVAEVYTEPIADTPAAAPRPAPEPSTKAGPPDSMARPEESGPRSTPEDSQSSALGASRRDSALEPRASLGTLRDQRPSTPLDPDTRPNPADQRVSTSGPAPPGAESSPPAGRVPERTRNPESRERWKAAVPLAPSEPEHPPARPSAGSPPTAVPVPAPLETRRAPVSWSPDLATSETTDLATPRAEMLPSPAPFRRRDPPDQAPPIEITIGCIDIRAEHPPAPRQVQPRRRSRRPLIALEDYVGSGKKAKR